MVDTSVLSSDQLAVWERVVRGDNLFVTARAGAGKSFLIDFIKRNYGPCLVTASTGVSANNVGGRTLHSQFLISISNPNASESASKCAATKRGPLIRWAKALIIDEISMVSDALLECVDIICRKIRGSSRPFGGLQLLFFGDFLQLPPVFTGSTAGDSVCLGCSCWKAANIQTVLLTSNFRQNGDRQFYGILTRLRYNHLYPEDIAALKARDLPAPDDALRLYSLNADASMLNSSMFEKLDASTEHSYIMTLGGEDKSRIEAFKRDTLFELELRLRVGARVMFLVNDNRGPEYLYNGALGTVVDFVCGLPLVKFDAGFTRVIDYWYLEINETDEFGNARTLVSCVQIPLRLAWACTVHKMQGMTVDSASIDCAGMFVYGQVYVALSRVKSLCGLYLKNFNPNAVAARSNPALVHFYEELEQAAFDSSSV